MPLNPSAEEFVVGQNLFNDYQPTPDQLQAQQWAAAAQFAYSQQAAYAHAQQLWQASQLQHLQPYGDVGQKLPGLPPPGLSSNSAGVEFSMQGSLSKEVDKWDVQDDEEFVRMLETPGALKEACFSQAGCRKLQELLTGTLKLQKKLRNPDRAKLMQKLEGDVMDVAMHPHGNYVLYSCLENMSAKDVGFIFKSVVEGEHAVTLAKNKCGCRVVVRLIQFENGDEKETARPSKQACAQIVETLLQNVSKLIFDIYGHFVIKEMHIIGGPDTEKPDNTAYRRRIAKVIIGDPFTYSKDRHASRIVEEVLLEGVMEDRQALMREMTKDDMLNSLAGEQFGKYVFNTVTKLRPEYGL